MASSRSNDIMIRLADEGVPISAIVRAFRRPFPEVYGVCAEARDCGELLDLPANDWPIHSRRDAREPTKPALRLSDMEATTTALMWAFALTEREAVLVGALLRQPSLTKAALHNIISPLTGRATDPKIVDVYICSIRKKLRPHGVELVSIRGRGIMLPPAGAAELRSEIAKFERSLQPGARVE